METEKMADPFKYLPAAYQPDPNDHTSPLNALLLIQHRNFSSIQEKINRIETFFDPTLTPAAAPADFLAWLASWVSLELDDQWSEEKKRELVKDAAKLHRRRGTPNGLKLWIKRFFNVDIEIEEWTWPRGMEIQKHSTIGIDSILHEQPDIRRCFKIVWKPSYRDIEPGLITKIRTLIDRQKPKHTKCYFSVEYPGETETAPMHHGMIIGIFSTLGKCCIGDVKGNNKE